MTRRDPNRETLLPTRSAWDFAVERENAAGRLLRVRHGDDLSTIDAPSGIDGSVVQLNLDVARRQIAKLQVRPNF